MSVTLHMVLAVQGMSLSDLPLGTNVPSRADCVSLCYFSRTCLSIFYDTSTSTCHLTDAVYDRMDMHSLSVDMQYFVWQPTPSGGCRTDYSWSDVMNRCFKVYSVWNTWQEAEDQCIQDGGHLIKIDTFVTNTIMNDLASNQGFSFWFGGRDLDMTSSWKWIDNSTVENLYWSSGQPDDFFDENCLMLDEGGGWHDAPCDDDYYSICQTSPTQQYNCGH